MASTISNRTALAAIISPNNGQGEFLAEAGREGMFVFSDSNLSASVGNDPRQGLYVAPASDTSGASGAWVRQAHNDRLDVRWFGATGTGAETLSSTSYSTDVTSAPVTITQQTADGLAINAAIVYLRSIGGGTLYVPKGEYRTYAYLERIDFALNIEGDGRGLSRSSNCAASPTDAHGYGILVIQPSALSDITIRGLALDGRVLDRASPGSGVENRNYPLAVYGSPRIVVDEVAAINSPIDCLTTAYDNSGAVSLQAVNCLFSNAFRNTVSNVAGWNQQYTNCIVEKGGVPHGGTNPKYCLDIEPNAFESASTIKNLTYMSCIFREAVNVVASGIWAGNVRFVGCLFQAYGGPAGGGATPGQPWLGNFRGGEFTFSDCTFEFTGGSYDGHLQFEPPPGTGDYAATEFVRMEGCYVHGAGISGFGLHMIIDNVEVKNSLRPVFFGGNGTQHLRVNNITLINVFDPDDRNAGSGSFSSFAFGNTFEGYAVLDGLHIRIEPPQMPPDLITSLSATGVGYGFYNGAAPSSTSEIKISNVHVAGFYRKLPTAIGKAPNANNFRDWASPNVPPADTAGQTAGPGTTFYRNCTMYGDVA